MKKIWQYIHFDPETGKIAPGEDHKITRYYQVDSPGPDYEDISTDELILAKEYSNYESRIVDGLHFYNEFRAKLYIKIINGEALDTDIFSVENHLESVADLIWRGNWLTAKNELENIELLLPVFTQEFKDDIMQKIDSYIAENY